MPALVPLDEIGIFILAFTFLVVAGNIYTQVTLGPKQVGRFGKLLRVTFGMNLVWQAMSILYFMGPFEVPEHLNYAGTLDFLAATSYGTLAIFVNSSILEAFEVLTNLSRKVTNTFRVIAVIFWAYTHFLHFGLYYGKLPYLQAIIKPSYLAFAMYIFLMVNFKTLYLLRVLYVDKLQFEQRQEDASSERIKQTKKKYHKLQLFFIILCVFNFVGEALWAMGHLYLLSRPTKLAESMTGIELFFYPRLIMGFRDLRFDQSQIESSRAKTLGPTIEGDTSSFKQTDTLTSMSKPTKQQFRIPQSSIASPFKRVPQNSIASPFKQQPKMPQDS